MQSELAKAVSMGAPLLMLLHVYERPVKNKRLLAFYVGMLLVIASSFVYHFLCHLNYYESVIDNDARRLDQSMLHVNSALTAFALSGSTTYFGFVAVFALTAVWLLWKRGEHDTRALRRANIGATLCLAILPMVWRHDYFNLVGGAAALVITASLFAHGGAGHTLSHLFLPFYIYFVYRSTRDF